MGRFTHIRNNFLVGEASPKMWGRTELNEYTQMCEKLRNVVVYPQGGSGRRVGSQYVCDISGISTTGVKIFPFSTSNGEYIIIISDTFIQYVRVDGSNLPVDVTTQNLDPLEYGDDWSYGSELTTKAFAHAQYGDLLFITTGQRDPLVIARLPPGAPAEIGYFRFGEGNTTFPLSGAVWTNTEAHRTMAWIDENTTATTITPSATTGNITLTASAGIFTSDMVSSQGRLGTLFRIRSGATVGVAKVTGYTNATTLSATVLKTLPGTAAYSTWSESAWSIHRGFPRAVQFHQQRLFWGGTNHQPDTLWASQIGDYAETSKADITSTFKSSDAISLSFATNELSSVNFMSSGRKNLEVGTNKREVTVEPATADLAQADIVFTANYESADGSAYIQPVRANNTLIFLDRFSQRVKEFSYDFREDSYKTQDLTYFAEDILKRVAYGTNKQPLEMAFQSVEHSIVWFNCQDQLVGLTRSREYNIFAFHKHYLGGKRDNGIGQDVVPRIDSMCNLTRLTGQDELYFTVFREINGEDVIYLEKFSTEFDGDTLNDYYSFISYLNKYPIYMDCAYIQTVNDLAPTDTWDAPMHAGETVHLIGDGKYLGEIEVGADGTFTTDEEYSWVITGFNYESVIIPVALQSNAVFGSGIGQIKRVSELTILFNRTVGASFGVLTDEANLEEIQFMPIGNPPNDPIPLFTGEKTVKLSATYEGRQNIVLKQTKPLPFQVTAVVAKGILYD